MFWVGRLHADSGYIPFLAGLLLAGVGIAVMGSVFSSQYRNRLPGLTRLPADAAVGALLRAPRTLHDDAQTEVRSVDRAPTGAPKQRVDLSGLRTAAVPVCMPRPPRRHGRECRVSRRCAAGVS